MKRPGRGGCLVALAIALVLVPLAIWAVSRAVSLPVHVVVEKVGLREPPDAPAPDAGPLSQLFDRLGGIAETFLGQREVVVTLRVRNDLPVPARLNAIRYTVHAGEREIAAGVWQPEGGPRTCAAGEEFVIDFGLTPDAMQALSFLWEKMRNQNTSVRLRGEASVTVLGLPLRRAFEVEHLEVNILGIAPSPGFPEPSPGDSEEAPVSPLRV